MKEFKNGILTGLTLQFAIGPVFFFIINLALQKSFFDGLAGVLAVTLVDYFYITLSILGIGKLLENRKTKKIFGAISSAVLSIFGMIIISGALGNEITIAVNTDSASIFSSFTSVFFLTIASPMTIVFFTSLFTAKAVEKNYTKKKLRLFGLGTGLATLLFMGSSVVLFSLVRGVIPVSLIQTLNLAVGLLLIGYGGTRLIKLYFKSRKHSK